MKIVQVKPLSDWQLAVIAEGGREGLFDVRPYLQYEAFQPLQAEAVFAKVSNGGYFVEWACGADLSADSIEARWRVRELA